MASTLTDRVESLEGCVLDIHGDVSETKTRIATLGHDINEIKYMLNNGLSDRIAKSVRDYQEKDWERERSERAFQLEEFKVQNEVKGKRKDRNRNFVLGLLGGLVVFQDQIDKLLSAVFGG